MNWLEIVEILSVLTGLCFVVLLMYEKIACWIFGIISSLLSIYLFYETKLYSEAILYFYYVLIGIYGWAVWHRKEDDPLRVKTVSYIVHLVIISTGAVLGAALGYFFHSYTDAQRTYADAGSTIFSFLASYLQAQKILSSWIYWIIINAFSVWLYLDRGLQLYAGLMCIYFILSVMGWFQWRRSWQKSVLE